VPLEIVLDGIAEERERRPSSNLARVSLNPPHTLRSSGSRPCTWYTWRAMAAADDDVTSSDRWNAHGAAIQVRFAQSSLERITRDPERRKNYDACSTLVTAQRNGDSGVDSTATGASHLSIEDPGEARAVLRVGHHICQTGAIAPDCHQGSVSFLPKRLLLDGDPR
jgi:hypothetical protein